MSEARAERAAARSHAEVNAQREGRTQDSRGARLLTQSAQLLLGAALFVFSASSTLQLRDLRASQPQARSAADEVMFVSRREVTRALTLGYDQVAADVLWLRSIQYFATHLMSDRRYPLLLPLIEQLLSLDPRFKKAYFWAATSVLYGREITPERVRLANALYERAMARFPHDYEPPYRLGMSYYTELHAEDPEQRARDQARGLAYLERAASMPDAPSEVRELVRGIASRMGKDEVVFQALTDELLRERSPERRAIIKERLERLTAQMESSGELTPLIERAERQEAARLKEAPYLHPLVFELLTR